METLWFWVGTIVFVGTYVLIASEKVHKTVAALLGASLMMFFILPGPSHSGDKRVACVSSNDRALRYEGIFRMLFRILLAQCSFAFRHANSSALHPALAPNAAKALPNARFGQVLTCG